MKKEPEYTIRVIDARGMVHPEPFERVVEALTTLGRDERVKLVLNREPLPLYRFLEGNGYEYRVSPQAGGVCEILIWESRGK